MEGSRSERMLSKASVLVPAAAFMFLAAACADDRGIEPGVLTAVVPLHLEEHLDAAAIKGSDIPADLPEPIEWVFDRPQPDWRPVDPIPAEWQPIEISPIDDALRLSLGPANCNPWGQFVGSISIELPDGMRFEDWVFIEVRARTSDRMRMLGASYNWDDEDPDPPDFPFHVDGDRLPLLTDGTIQTYHLSLDVTRRREARGAWTHLALWCSSEMEPPAASLDVLSIRILPREATYAADRVGVRMEGRRDGNGSAKIAPDRRCLFVHAPGKVSYRVRIPAGGRLDVGLGLTRHDTPVTFEVTIEHEDGTLERPFSETYADDGRWAQRSVDLAHLAGQTVTLALETASEHVGTVALWAAPTLSGTRSTDMPNVVFYVIDGGGADYMSAFGYPRRTTPNLERIAAQGAVFDRAHSNSSWTRPSTASFLTSLQHSVLGGLQNGTNPVPVDVLTMAEHMHRAGYQTAVLTTNPNAGRVSGLDRGADAFREAGFHPHSISTVELHENFWTWRSDYPAEPYWVHFQPTDVHNDHTPVAPFAGLFADTYRRRRFDEWLALANKVPETDEVRLGEAAVQIGADRVEFWTAQRDLHDETMAHQDHQLGRLVARLKASGEWEHTLLIVAADHSVAAGSWDYALHMRDPEPAHTYNSDHAVPILRPGVSRVPLIFVWPGHIQPGQRFADPVSMIDVLPTILDLTGLPQPELAMGQSLAPLLLGELGWEPRPVVFDEFQLDDETGEYRGRIEMIDGRWGAALQINISPKTHPRFRREVPLLLFDLWEDPYCLRSVHAEHPDLVRHYKQRLEEQWAKHQTLRERFTRPEDSPLTSQQLEALRALGYVGEGG